MGPNFIGSRKFGRKSNNDGYYVANNYPTASNAAQPKSKTKLLIIVVAAAVVLISLFALIGSTRNSRKTPSGTILTSKEQLYSDISELKNEWNIFFDDYQRKIGLTPNLVFDEEAVFPKGNFSNLKEEYDTLKETNSTIQKSSLEKLGLSSMQVENISNLKKEVDRVIPLFEKNINTMERLYVSFETFRQGEEAGLCKKTSQIEDLIKEGPEKISSATQSIFNAHCVMITDFDPESFSSEEDYDAFLDKKNTFLRSAINDLDSYLDTIKEEEVNINDLFTKIKEEEKNEE